MHKLRGMVLKVKEIGIVLLDFADLVTSYHIHSRKVWRIDSFRAFGELIDQPIDY